MTNIDLINTGILTIGIPSIFASLIYIGRKLQVLDELNITVDKIKNNLKVVIDFLIQNNNNFPCSRLANYSPISLTQDGHDFLQKISFYQIFETHKKDFIECINEDSPKSKLEVETSAIKSILFLFERDYFKSVKDFLYNNPFENKNDFAKIAGVYIRDQYLRLHPEIS